MLSIVFVHIQTDLTYTNPIGYLSSIPLIIATEQVAQLFSTNTFNTNTFYPNCSSLITLKLHNGLFLKNLMSFSRYLFSLMKVCNEIVRISNRLRVNSSESRQNVESKMVMNSLFLVRSSRISIEFSFVAFH